MILVAPLPTTVPDWQPVEAIKIELDADYYIETSDGQLEAWHGYDLYLRMRPEFIYGRAVRIAKVEDPL
jgi:hypothetical protein